MNQTVFIERRNSMPPAAPLTTRQMILIGLLWCAFMGVALYATAKGVL